MLRLQIGREPTDWKPLTTVGQGVCEIRIRDEQGIFRVVYVAKFAKTIFILHCFQKKSQKTNHTDIELAVSRYKEIAKEQKR